MYVYCILHIYIYIYIQIDIVYILTLKQESQKGNGWLLVPKKKVRAHGETKRTHYLKHKKHECSHHILIRLHSSQKDEMWQWRQLLAFWDQHSSLLSYEQYTQVLIENASFQWAFCIWGIKTFIFQWHFGRKIQLSRRCLRRSENQRAEWSSNHQVIIVT